MGFFEYARPSLDYTCLALFVGAGTYIHPPSWVQHNCKKRKDMKRNIGTCNMCDKGLKGRSRKKKSRQFSLNSFGLQA